MSPRRTIDIGARALDLYGGAVGFSITGEERGTGFLLSSEGCKGYLGKQYFWVTCKHVLTNGGGGLGVFFRRRGGSPGDVLPVMIPAHAFTGFADPTIDLVAANVTATISRNNLSDVAIPYTAIAREELWPPRSGLEVVALVQSGIAEPAWEPSAGVAMRLGSVLARAVQDDGQVIDTNPQRTSCDLLAGMGNSGSPVFAAFAGKVKLAGVIHGGGKPHALEVDRVTHITALQHAAHLANLVEQLGTRAWIVP